MIMDPLHQQQEVTSNSNTLENMLGCSKESNKKPKPQPQPEHALKCPRCESTNTKFCYYNNYSLSQPRYFCKSCRRYWTKGGTLRNVPVGGGCRKNTKRPSSSSLKRSQSQDQQMISTNQNHPVLSSYDSNDLTLAFAMLQKQQQQNLGINFDHHDIDLSHQGGYFLDALNQNPNNFQNLCYGSGSYGNGDGTMKQEMCNNNSFRNQSYEQSQSQSKSLLGLPWQINGDQSIDFNNLIGEVDSARESWNGFDPSWHGLLNSPLM